MGWPIMYHSVGFTYGVHWFANIGLGRIYGAPRDDWFSTCDGFITTSASCSQSWWGTLISNHNAFNPVPWISVVDSGANNPNPKIIWYWVR